MSEITIKLKNRALRLRRSRKNTKGTTDRPRLSVRISNRHVLAQIIDDETHKTLAQVSTASKDIPKTIKNLTEKSEWAGKEIAGRAKKAKVSKVVFDRGHKLYHGRIKTLADTARKEGLDF